MRARQKKKNILTGCWNGGWVKGQWGGGVLGW